MGELIVLSERMADRSRPATDGRAAFFFELGCPLSYLAAEQVERSLGDVEWIPTARLDGEPGRGVREVVDVLDVAERYATELRLPLVVPERFGADLIGAWRAAAFASEQGAGALFAVAASRLAFCGGYDLDETRVLAEAAAAAGLVPSEVLAA